MAPNTKWCGRGQSASKYNELGGASKADKCCRRHDHCKLNIQAMNTKWNLFNFRPFTISHCSCDTRLVYQNKQTKIFFSRFFMRILKKKNEKWKTKFICEMCAIF